jgi:hypothetical protein
VSSRARGGEHQDLGDEHLQQLEVFGRGFTPEERAQAEKISAVRVMAFSLRDPAAVRHADQLAERVAAATGAYLFDTATRELFTLAAWRSRRLSAWNGERPMAERHVSVHAYRDGAAYRAVSLGMEKFGVPDFAVNWIRGEDLGRVDTLVQLTLQSLVEQGKTTVSLATKSGDVAVHLVTARPAEGDAENRLLEVADPINPLLDQLGNAEELRGIRQDDPELTAAVAQVRARVPTLSRRFAAGLGPTGRLRVKASFENEAMWVEVTTWENGELRGRLLDHPQFATKLVGGEIVRLREAEMLDYQLTGVAAPEGPFLQEILERKGRKGSP